MSSIDDVNVEIGYLEGLKDVMWAMSLGYDEMNDPEKAWRSLSAWLEELTDRIRGRLDSPGEPVPSVKYIKKKIKQISTLDKGRTVEDILNALLEDVKDEE